MGLLAGGTQLGFRVWVVLCLMERQRVHICFWSPVLVCLIWFKLVSPWLLSVICGIDCSIVLCMRQYQLLLWKVHTWYCVCRRMPVLPTQVGCFLAVVRPAVACGVQMFCSAVSAVFLFACVCMLKHPPPLCTVITSSAIHSALLAVLPAYAVSGSGARSSSC